MKARRIEAFHRWWNRSSLRLIHLSIDSISSSSCCSLLPAILFHCLDPQEKACLGDGRNPVTWRHLWLRGQSQACRILQEKPLLFELNDRWEMHLTSRETIAHHHIIGSIYISLLQAVKRKSAYLRTVDETKMRVGLRVEDEEWVYSLVKLRQEIKVNALMPEKLKIVFACMTSKYWHDALQFALHLSFHRFMMMIMTSR